MNFLFSMNDVKAMAIFVSQLVREGVTFTVSQAGENFTITLTGGF
jgi:hypothetical protein